MVFDIIMRLCGAACYKYGGWVLVVMCLLVIFK